jgi:hypothetical protein
MCWSSASTVSTVIRFGPVRDLRPYREGWLAGRVREGVGAALVILLPLNMFCAALTIASSDEG